jgi:phosphoribosylaminoimidazole-succinocarboxamide synthase
MSADLAPYLGHVLDAVDIPELPNHYRGKVRENYDLADGRRILIATDRLSAFDIVLASIPLKGQVLTQTARYWFEATADLCASHVLDYPDPNVVVGERLTILPVEMVVRGYLAGTTGTSILTMYQAGRREMYGIRLPDGMRPHQVLPAPIITPTTKAGTGGHDTPLTAASAEALVTPAQWRQMCDFSFALFARGQSLAAMRGLILADTKYEFGVAADGAIKLADEIHTPDSSRYWFAASYEDRFARGQKPESFDKDFVRNWVTARCDPYGEAVPPIPAEIVLQTARVYIQAFETITGQAFSYPDPAERPLERIRGNLRQFFAG